VRFEAVRGKWSAASAAFLLLGFACAPPANTNQVASITSPTPSPSPTPTVPVKASASAPFHGGEVGVTYAPVALTATGGVAPYTWTLTSGALPAGLTLGSDGSVSGTPTSAGSFTFTIQAADSGSSSASLPGEISIAPALAASLIPSCATYCYVELGCVSVCGNFGQLSGGVPTPTASRAASSRAAPRLGACL
jgi:Putative Ig domain